MTDNTLTLWRRADARREWLVAIRNCVSTVGASRDLDVSAKVAGWEESIAICDEIKTACESELAKEIDGDPDAWLYDAFR